MKESNNALLIEIRDLLKEISKDQQCLMNDIKELKDEQRKLKEEIRLSNFVLNNITLRNELLN